MAIQSFQLDPNAASYTDDQIVGKVNSATANITRASSVDAAARPIASGEVGSTELATGAIKTKVEAESDANKLAAGALQAAAAITGTQLDSTAAKDSLDALADTARGYIKTSPVSTEFRVVAIQRASDGKLDIDYDDVAV